MPIVAPLHRYFSSTHLDDVIGTMAQLGAPRIRAYFDTESAAWLAYEGTHRLRAAFALGLAPILIPIAWWRTRAALVRARFAAIDYGYAFSRVQVQLRVAGELS